MKRVIVRWLRWLLRKLGYRDVPVSAPVRKMAAAALPLVLTYDAIKDVSGEYRRHQVYARMIDAFPEADRDDLGFAIELAVQRMKGKLLWR